MGRRTTGGARHRPGARTGCLRGRDRRRGSSRVGTLVRLFVFGMGYSATHYVQHHAGAFTDVAGTVRTREKVAELGPLGLKAFLFDGPAIDSGVFPAVA